MTVLTEIDHFLPLTDTLLTGGQPTEAQFQAIADAGVQTVINLALATSPHALPDEAGLVRRLGMDYVHIPVVWESPTREALIQFMDTMDGQKGRRLMIHCAANMRVSAFVALYRILRQGWARQAATQDLLRIWNPDENEVWRKFIAQALDPDKPFTLGGSEALKGS